MTLGFLFWKCEEFNTQEFTGKRRLQILYLLELFEEYFLKYKWLIFQLVFTVCVQACEQALIFQIRLNAMLSCLKIREWCSLSEPGECG